MIQKDKGRVLIYGGQIDKDRLDLIDWTRLDKDIIGQGQIGSMKMERAEPSLIFTIQSRIAIYPVST